MIQVEGTAVCLPGEYSDVNDICTSCASGRHGETVSAKLTQCYPCGLGAFSSTPGATACEPCGLDSISGVLTTAAICSACEEGSIRDPDRVYCTNCGVGKHKVLRIAGGNVSHVCDDCPSATYAVAGSANCSTCEGGTHVDALQGSCLTCSVGRYRHANSTSKVCAKCPPSKYAPIGSSECAMCKILGSFPDKARGSCLQCSSGTYRARDDSCARCPPQGVRCESSSLQVRLYNASKAENLSVF
jgi:hypothetical protein